MSGTFKGFTEQDIQQLKKPMSDTPPSGPPLKKGILKNKNSHSVTIRKMPGEQRVEILDNNARLFQQDKISNINSHEDDKNTDNLNYIESAPAVIEIKDDIAEEISPKIPINDCTDVSLSEFKEIELNDTIQHSYDKRINLEEFQRTQKLIEEQNRKRKEMLSKALEDRSKKTAEEVEKINIIKKELQTLDNQLSDDVSILRKKIEKHCAIYSEAEKAYFRVEKEFLNAKITLQKEKEKKELLTEHLCTLIAHNEARKAKKLENLMEQLAYDTCSEKLGAGQVPAGCDGVCEKTGKILEMDNGKPQEISVDDCE